MNLSAKHLVASPRPRPGNSAAVSLGKASVEKLTCGPPREKAREQPDFREALAAQIQLLNRVEQQLTRGLRMASTAERALEELVSLLAQMEEIAGRACSGELPAELIGKVAAMDRLIADTRVDDQPLLTGELSHGLELTIGWEAGSSQNLLVLTLPCLTPSALGIDAQSLRSAAQKGPRGTAELIETAARDVRGTLGTLRDVLTRLREAEERFSVASENCSAANSRPLDLDALFGAGTAAEPSALPSPA